MTKKGGWKEEGEEAEGGERAEQMTTSGAPGSASEIFFELNCTSRSTRPRTRLGRRRRLLLPPPASACSFTSPLLLLFMTLPVLALFLLARLIVVLSGPWGACLSRARVHV